MVRILVIGASALAAIVVAVMVGLGQTDSPDESGVYAVTYGMTSAQVRALAGAPERSRGDCWRYRTNGDAVSVCFVERRFCVAGVCRFENRVSDVQAASGSRSDS